MSLDEINQELGNISNQIEAKMKFLQEKYNFSLDYAFKPITEQDIINFESLQKPKPKPKF